MSNVNCPRCNASNTPAARFCQACGATLGVTSVGGKTVVVQPNVTDPPTAPMHFIPGIETSTDSLLRESTIFTLDISGSMGELLGENSTKLQAATRAATNMVVHKAKVDPQDEIGLVTFTDQATLVMPLSPIASHKRQIIEAFRSLRADSGTDINEGLKAAREAFDWSRQGVVRRIILLTDGHGGHPLSTAEDLKSRGVVIDVIGVGDDPRNVDEKLLRKVASTIRGEVQYRFIKDQRTLLDHVTHLGEKTLTA